MQTHPPKYSKLYFFSRQPTLTSLSSSPQLSKNVRESARNEQTCLDEWSLYRKLMIKLVESDCAELNEWKTNCAISAIVGGGIGMISGGATIVGFVLCPPVGIAGAIVATVTGVSGTITAIAKWNHRAKVINKLKARVETDRELFEKLMESHSNLMNKMAEDIATDDYDYSNQLMTILGAPVTIARGGTAIACLMKVGVITSNLAKGVFHSIVIVGIVLDGISIAINVKDLSRVSKLGERIKEILKTYKEHLEQVLNKFSKVEASETDSNDGSVNSLDPNYSILIQIFSEFTTLLKKANSSINISNLENEIGEFYKSLNADRQRVWHKFLQMSIWELDKCMSPADSDESDENDTTESKILDVLIDLILVISSKDLKTLEQIVEEISILIKSLEKNRRKAWQEFLNSNISILESYIRAQSPINSEHGRAESVVQEIPLDTKC